jgi:predicted DCC family thiol-disulfide oxidoreductase YuxK
MEKLFVLYDANCGLCCRLKDWVQAQPAWIAMEMVEAGSEAANSMFPASIKSRMRAT